MEQHRVSSLSIMVYHGDSPPKGENFIKCLAVDVHGVHGQATWRIVRHLSKCTSRCLVWPGPGTHKKCSRQCSRRSNLNALERVRPDWGGLIGNTDRSINSE